MPSVHMKPISSHAYLLEGELTRFTVPNIFDEGSALVADKEQLVLDLSGLTFVDSAGLALLVEWFSQAQTLEHSIQFLECPPQLRAISELSNVSEVLGL